MKQEFQQNQLQAVFLKELFGSNTANVHRLGGHQPFEGKQVPKGC